MSKRNSTSFETKLHVVQRCLAHKSNPNYEAKQVGVSTHTVKEWIRKYRADGLDGLKRSNTWKAYSKEWKLAAIHDVLSGHCSIDEATRKHRISSRSVLGNWITMKPSAKELEVLSLAKEVKLRYDKRKGALGYRQMRTQLNRKLKKNYNKKRYYRMMRALGLKAVIRKKRPNYVKASEVHLAENVMNCEFHADSPNLKWCTDVTELKYGNGRKAYLSAIVDVYDNSVVSWVLSHSNNNKLVMDTVKKAYRKNPGVAPLLHSDRGFQYTSHEYNRLTNKYRFTKSMSPVSRCLDNQPVERFWGTFKTESFYLTKYETYEDVRNDVSNYIRYYNNYRYTERLNGLSPNEYRKQAA